MTEGGYVEGSIESTEGDKVIVKIGKDEKKILKKDQVQQVINPWCIIILIILCKTSILFYIK